MDRRAILQWMVATGGLAAFSRFTASDLATLGEETHARLRVAPTSAKPIAPQEATILELAAEAIIPRTNTPGATDAKVLDFMQVMLDEWYTPEERNRLINGVRQLELESTRRYNKGFRDLTSEQRADVVTHFDQEVAELKTKDPNAINTHWFAMLKYLTVWGYCTSEVAMREVFHSFPRQQYNAFAPVR